MKSKILTLTVLTLLLVSCGTQKTAAVATTQKATPPATETAKATELTPELAAGKNLYDNSCAKCHRLYEAKEFSKEDWKPILTKMQKKAHLDDTQMASISDYITSQL